MTIEQQIAENERRIAELRAEQAKIRELLALRTWNGPLYMQCLAAAKERFPASPEIWKF